MKRLGVGLLYGVAAYLLAAVLGYVLILHLSSNVHDREVEAAMTSAFFIGPVAALVAFVAGIFRAGRPDR